MHKQISVSYLLVNNYSEVCLKSVDIHFLRFVEKNHISRIILSKISSVITRSNVPYSTYAHSYIFDGIVEHALALKRFSNDDESINHFLIKMISGAQK